MLMLAGVHGPRLGDGGRRLDLKVLYLWHQFCSTFLSIYGTYGALIPLGHTWRQPWVQVRCTLLECLNHKVVILLLLLEWGLKKVKLRVFDWVLRVVHWEWRIGLSTTNWSLPKKMLWILLRCALFGKALPKLSFLDQLQVVINDQVILHLWVLGLNEELILKWSRDLLCGHADGYLVVASLALIVTRWLLESSRVHGSHPLLRIQDLWGCARATSGSRNAVLTLSQVVWIGDRLKNLLVRVMKRFCLQDRFQFVLRTVRKIWRPLKMCTLNLKHSLSRLSRRHILSEI